MKMIKRIVSKSAEELGIASIVGGRIGDIIPIIGKPIYRAGNILGGACLWISDRLSYSDPVEKQPSLVTYIRNLHEMPRIHELPSSDEERRIELDLYPIYRWKRNENLAIQSGEDQRLLGSGGRE